MNWFDKIATLGVNDNTETRLRKSVRTVNIVSLVTAILVAFFVVLIMLVADKAPNLSGLLITSLGAIPILLLNKLKKFGWAKLTLMIVVLYHITFETFNTGGDALGKLELIPIGLLPFLIFTNKENHWKYISWTIIGAWWFVLDYIQLNFTPLSILHSETTLFLQTVQVFLLGIYTIILLLQITRNMSEDIDTQITHKHGKGKKITA